jgi:DNA-directed RNA polymerase subunit K/omega
MTRSKKPKTIKEESENENDIENEIEYEEETEVIESIYDEEDIIDDVDSEDELIEEGDDDENDQTECLLEKITGDDNDFFENLFDNNIKNDIIEEMVEPNKRISPNRLTKYEMVRILGERTKQLTLGAKPMIKNYQGLSYDKIAEEELKLSMIPFKIKRPLPNGKYELWLLNELKKDHLLSYLE